jgi:hypothetical protein
MIQQGQAPLYPPDSPIRYSYVVQISYGASVRTEILAWKRFFGTYLHR